MSPAVGARSPLRVVGAAIVDDLLRPSRLLAARRTGPPALAGGWELPGGKVEEGEDPEQALHRELREELGIVVDLGGEVTASTLPGWDGGWPVPRLQSGPADPVTSPPESSPADPGGRLRVWLASVRSGEPAPLEDHDAVCWLPRGQWLSLGWLAVDLPVVHHLDATSPR